MKAHFRWWPRGRKALAVICSAIVVALAILTVLDGFYLNWQFTGFGSKPLWDWLELLIVPIILAVGGYWFTRSEKNEAALQEYLGQMSELLLDKDKKIYDTSKDNKARVVAQARTITILRRLDGKRKGVVLLFLYETSLINKGKPIIDLRYADLRDVILPNAILRDAHLEGTDLSYADLRSADLRGTKLARAMLIGAYLDNADLRNNADLSGANLSNANLNSAQLSEATLRAAILKGAQLYDANLSGPTNLMLAELDGVDLRKTVLDGADLRGAKTTGAKFTKKQQEQLAAETLR